MDLPKSIDYDSAMIQTIDDRARIAAELPPDQRYTLVRRILASVEPAVATDYDPAWASEIRQRMMRFDAGETAGIPAAEVFAEIERSLVQ